MRVCQRYSKISYAVTAWEKPGENRGVGSIGDWAWREGLRKTDSLSCKAVERRSFNLLISVAVNVIGTKSINGDQKDVWGGVLRWARFSLCAQDHEADKNEI